MLLVLEAPLVVVSACRVLPPTLAGVSRDCTAAECHCRGFIACLCLCFTISTSRHEESSQWTPAGVLMRRLAVVEVVVVVMRVVERKKEKDTGSGKRENDAK